MARPSTPLGVAVPADVLVQRLPDGECVFLNLATEEYYGLDATGTAMWAALTETGRIDRALERLGDEFDIDPETLRRDLDALVQRLVDRGLLRVGDESEGPPPSVHSG